MRLVRREAPESRVSSRLIVVSCWKVHTVTAHVEKPQAREGVD